LSQTNHNQSNSTLRVTNFGIFAIFLLLVAFSAVVRAETMCDLSIQDVNSAAMLVTASDFPSELKSAPILLVGEQHYSTPLEAASLLVEGFAKSHPTGACMALEFRPDLPTVDEILSDMISRLESLKKITNPDTMTQKFTSVFSDVTSYYGPINDLAKRHQIKIFAADNPNMNASIDERNLYIANFIGKLIEAGQCSSVLGMFGKVHLSKGMMRSTNIRDLLRQNNIQTFSVNMQMTNEQNTIRLARSFDVDCKPQKIIPAFTWVRSAALRIDPKLLPRIDGEDSTYGQFDFTFLVPSYLLPRPQTTYVDAK
jgi:hypothetical protein